MKEAAEATGKDKKEISKIYVEEKKKSMAKGEAETATDPDAVLRGELDRLLKENPKLTLNEAAEAVGKDKKEIGKIYVEEKKKSMGKA